MIQNSIDSLVENINNSLIWIKDNRPNDYNQKFLQLVENRRILKRIARASESNPGIAAFGKSQVGKSYLISCLLQDNGNPFMVKTEKNEYNFVFSINPPSDEGGGRESTGVVTRFSSFNRNPEMYSPKYPVTIKTFSISDIVAILSDSYFNDFGNYTTISEKEVLDMIDSLKKKYGHSYNNGVTAVYADDILNLKEYFFKYINNAQIFIRTPFFNHLAMLIENIPPEDYARVFAVLWNNDNNITKLFNKLFYILSKFNFKKYIYLPIEAVLHKDVKENTILSVQCLKQLFDENSQYTSDVYTKENNDFVKIATGMPKSSICAICSEVIFKIEDSFLDSCGKYCFDNIAPEVSAKISKEEIKMTMFRDNDLLDFPGARAREQEDIQKLSENSILLNCFLRGKVAYLFNKYNSDKTINILLYCHHNKDNDVTSLYKLLQDWVNEYVGKTPEARRNKIEQTKLSPLFYIGTMFNLDMTLGVGANDSEEAIEQRWIGRFDTVMNKQCFHTDTVDWVNNWTDKGVGFQNSYILRDYKFSGPKAGLYSGFDETHKEQKMIMSERYYQMMRKSFIRNSYVNQLFENPDLAWDVAASINNDGALFIMQNIAIVAQRMNKARESDFNNEINRIKNNILNIIKDYFVSTDLNELLETNIDKSKAIFREMDFTCNADNYYFGHLIQALQINETVCYKVVHAIMQSPEINVKVNDFKDYEIIRSSCKKAGFPIDTSSKNKDNWNAIIKTYGFNSQNEAENFLERKKIDIHKLFDGSYKRKLNSCIIGDAIFDKWCSLIKSVDFLNEFSPKNGFDGNIMTYLVDNIILTAKSLNLKDRLAETINEYVNVINIHSANESFLADILASTINDFVLDFGFRYLSDEEKQKAENICKKKNIPAFKYIAKTSPEIFGEKDITDIFNEMSNNPQSLLPSFDDNYNKWMEYMFISFVAHLNIPDFDFQANQDLAEIINKIKKIS